MNIYNYIKNNNIVIDEINEIDALIFSRISYIHLEELKNKLPIKIGDINKYNLKMGIRDKKFIDLLTKSKRFCDIVITRCQNILDNEKIEQFFAVTFLISKNTAFIAFRGTNKSITGLMEDINMSYMTIPSQYSAAIYVNDERIYNLYLGGHSKGGNLAMYAAFNTNFFIKRRIKKVYNFDGPGFLSLNKKYMRVKRKIISFYPECSFVGRMLYNDSEKYVFKTFKDGLEGHNIYNWKILDNSLETGIFSKNSNDFALINDTLIKRIDINRRRIIVKEIFSLIKNNKFNISNFDFQELKDIIRKNKLILNDEKDILLEYVKILFKVMLPRIKRGRKNLHEKS